MNQQFYMIVHEPTGKFFAVKRSGRSAGYSFEEPTDKGVPRLFTRRQDADAALNVWLQGLCCWRTDVYGERYFDRFEPVPTRKAEDMRIVPVVLGQTCPTCNASWNVTTRECHDCGMQLP